MFGSTNLPYTVTTYIVKGTEGSYKSQFSTSYHSTLLPLSYRALSYMGLRGACFLIGTKIIWVIWIYVLKTLGWTVFWWSCPHIIKQQKLHKFWATYTSFFWSQKMCISMPYCTSKQIAPSSLFSFPLRIHTPLSWKFGRNLKTSLSNQAYKSKALFKSDFLLLLAHLIDVQLWFELISHDINDCTYLVLRFSWQDQSQVQLINSHLDFRFELNSG